MAFPGVVSPQEVELWAPTYNSHMAHGSGISIYNVPYMYAKCKQIFHTLGCLMKLSKWLGSMGYIAVIVHVVTFDPNFLGHPSGASVTGLPQKLR